MNLYLKNIAMLLCIILVSVMEACKKNHGPDFRDSLVGNYSCIEHLYNWSIYPNPPVGSSTDSIIGPATVSVSKLSTDDSSIVVNGTTFYIQYPITSQTINYYTINSFWGTPDYFYFTVQNDSIWFQNSILVQEYDHKYYYYAGRKQ